MTNASSDQSALVLFSGGQDSATCLAWALSRFERVETVGFSYGQRHVVGLESRAKLIDGTIAMWLDKGATWALSEELGGKELVDLIVEQSHTCYLGERGARHDWGYGCGECPACSLRARGWNNYVAARVSVEG